MQVSSTNLTKMALGINIRTVLNGISLRTAVIQVSPMLTMSSHRDSLYFYCSFRYTEKLQL